MGQKELIMETDVQITEWYCFQLLMQDTRVWFVKKPREAEIWLRGSGKDRAWAKVLPESWRKGPVQEGKL